jgi:hypothetical protein
MPPNAILKSSIVARELPARLSICEKNSAGSNFTVAASFDSPVPERFSDYR